MHMRARWREVVQASLQPALWIVGAMAVFIAAFLARKDLQTPVVAATAVILLWYTVETRGLRLEQRRLRKQQDADNELRNHPWLRATDLKPDWKADKEERVTLRKRVLQALDGLLVHSSPRRLRKPWIQPPKPRLRKRSHLLGNHITDFRMLCANADRY